jgi:hypothetical protein
MIPVIVPTDTSGLDYFEGIVLPCDNEWRPHIEWCIVYWNTGITSYPCDKADLLNSKGWKIKKYLTEQEALAWRMKYGV